uniref:Uncharacterized protein n=1 Tax=Thermosporothrix sp. COM3 TaxID=2490863 RepID=A0A455SHU1_9CHLR|nr:hypothetical protein KTC_27980 [Thermosporothrix sp. COM3]
MYNYDEITKRQAELEKRFPVNDFKLAPYYERLRSKKMASYQDLVSKGLLNGEHKSIEEAEIKALEFYRRLEQYETRPDEDRPLRRLYQMSGGPIDAVLTVIQ